MARLIERHVRRQQRHLGIGFHLDYDRARRGRRLLPRVAGLFGVVHVNTSQADEPDKAVVWHIGNVLRRLEFLVADHHVPFLRDLIQILVVEDRADQVRIGSLAPILRECRIARTRSLPDPAWTVFQI